MIETRQQLSEYIQADRNVQGMQHPLLAKISLLRILPKIEIDYGKERFAYIAI